MNQFVHFVYDTVEQNLRCEPCSRAEDEAKHFHSFGSAFWVESFDASDHHFRMHLEIKTKPLQASEEWS